MEEVNFEKAFEVLKQIQSQVVPKAKYEESQNEVEKLKSMLEDANGQVRGLVGELKNMRARWECEKELMKAQNEEQKLKFDVVEAEKKRLEAVANNWEASYNEINLKLILKNHQFNSLTTDDRKCKADEAEKSSIGTQTIKDEPNFIPAVNVPSSCSSCQTSPDIPTLFTELQNSPTTSSAGKSSVGKRKRSGSGDQGRRKSKRINAQKIFNCQSCFYKWADGIEYDGDKKINAHDPSDYLTTFSSLRDLKLHLVEKHGWSRNGFCKKKSCHETKIHNYYRAHGDLVCGTCARTFEREDDLDVHVKFTHADFATMNNDQLLEVYDKLVDR